MTLNINHKKGTTVAPLGTLKKSPPGGPQIFAVDLGFLTDVQRGSLRIGPYGVSALWVGL